jgi:2-polyprenyl-6-methoxyphenol hydroxylase-like FAD-dependent oxidoreductase
MGDQHAADDLSRLADPIGLPPLSDPGPVACPRGSSRTHRGPTVRRRWGLCAPGLPWPGPLRARASVARASVARAMERSTHRCGKVLAEAWPVTVVGGRRHRICRFGLRLSREGRWLACSWGSNRGAVIVAIVGAGPTGSFLSLGLARRGHTVVVVDRDPGPISAVEWPRTGVMQFRLPHVFRPQVRDALLAEAPEVVDSLLAEGALPTTFDPTSPGWVGFRVRRATFERTLRAAAAAERNVTLVVGQAQQVTLDGSRVTGLIVDGSPLEADLVIDASGRAGNFGGSLRSPAVGGNCGFSYVARQYRLRPAAEHGPLNSPPGWAALHDGYVAIVFLQDAATFQVLIMRASDDLALRGLHRLQAFEAAAAAIPCVADWVDQQRAEPEYAPIAGTRTYNTYRGQLGQDGTVAANGLLFVGDAVMTTNPADARGVTTSLLQAQRLLYELDTHGRDFSSVSLSFDQWCTETMRPWFDDSIRSDAGLLSRWRGEPVDLGRPLPSDLICSVGEIDPSVLPAVGAYRNMLSGPSVLSSVEPRAREHFALGFKPPVSAGPTHGELALLAGNA